MSDWMQITIQVPPMYDKQMLSEILSVFEFETETEAEWISVKHGSAVLSIAPCPAPEGY